VSQFTWKNVAPKSFLEPQHTFAEAQEFSKKFEEVMDINAGLITAPETTEEDETAKEADKLAEEVEAKVTV
jgi:hypothetical protein